MPQGAPIKADALRRSVLSVTAAGRRRCGAHAHRRAAHGHGRPDRSGELAGEPAGVLLLAAMGYNSFSMNSSNLAKIKWLLRRVQMSELALLLPEILACQSAKQVRLHIQRFLEQKQLLSQLRA